MMGMKRKVIGLLGAALLSTGVVGCTHNHYHHTGDRAAGDAFRSEAAKSGHVKHCGGSCGKSDCKPQADCGTLRAAPTVVAQPRDVSTSGHTGLAANGVLDFTITTVQDGKVIVRDCDGNVVAHVMDVGPQTTTETVLMPFEVRSRTTTVSTIAPNKDCPPAKQ